MGGKIIIIIFLFFFLFGHLAPLRILVLGYRARVTVIWACSVQTLSRLFQLVQFVKCWHIFLKLKSKRLNQSLGEETEILCLRSRPPQNVKLGPLRCSRAATAKKQ